MQYLLLASVLFQKFNQSLSLSGNPGFSEKVIVLYQKLETGHLNFCCLIPHLMARRYECKDSFLKIKALNCEIGRAHV